MATADTVSLILRVLVGITLAAHGYNHMFGQGGLNGTSRWFGSLGLRPPKVHALLSGVGELVFGLALVVGLLTSLAAAFVVGAMTVAAVIAHRKNGFFVFKDGYEYVLVLAVVSVCLAITGPGVASVDHLLGISVALDGAAGAGIAAGGGTLGAAVTLAFCWRPSLTRTTR